jgi:hypothetical protein
MEGDGDFRIDDETGGEIAGAAHRGRHIVVEKATHLVAERLILGGE